ncbi:hypothetical protein HPP92_015818 [Vanilla planifolia]|uniref:LNS2/PITP domain-containing protein n=1 Tax=Vanilla planifolia TaxID=51239 RepID=A0A835QLW8_VANPL|nr:hypothetical protein HPP92_027217 [Vanilla planifolia]KAG0471272.1 hypothetical protein HPP92_015818 [Vanilla planifolia]
MYAVGKLGSYISHGVYTVSGPFHPFGGAIDIIVVRQPDGSFKSSPWYVRFGKFQGVLKTKEKIVTICVNGVEAGFQMYLNHKGEAFFLKESENKEGDCAMSPPTSGDEMDATSRDLYFGKTKRCNYDGSLSNIINPNAAESGKLINTTTSQSSKILGRMFGRRLIKENKQNPGFERVSSLERAEIAANLLEVKWSTSLSAGELWSNGSQKKRTDARNDFKEEQTAEKDGILQVPPTDSKHGPVVEFSSLNGSIGYNSEGNSIRRVLVEEKTFSDHENLGEDDMPTSERKDTTVRSDGLDQLPLKSDKKSSYDTSGIGSITDNLQFDMNLCDSTVTEVNFNERVFSIPQKSASEDVLELYTMEVGSSVENDGRNTVLCNFKGDKLDIEESLVTCSSSSVPMSHQVSCSGQESMLQQNGDYIVPNHKFGQLQVVKNVEELKVIMPCLSDKVSTIEGFGVNDCSRTMETEIALSGTAEGDELSSDGGSPSPMESNLDASFNVAISKDEPNQSKDEVYVHLLAKDVNDHEDDIEGTSKPLFEGKRTQATPIKISQGKSSVDNAQMYSRSLPAVHSGIHDLEEAHYQSFRSSSVSLRPEKSDSDLLKLDEHNILSPEVEREKSCFRHSPHGGMEQDVYCQTSDPEKKQIFERDSIVADDNARVDQQVDASPSVPSGGNWRLWPFGFKRSKTINIADSSDESIHQEHSDTDSISDNSLGNANTMPKPKNLYKQVQWLTPSSEEVSSLNLKEGPNVVTFSFLTPMLGKQQVDARIYLWTWDTQIVISDVDGTITRSDVLGQFMPLVGIDWSQTGVAHLFSAIRENGYQLLFLSARAISQSHLTRQFLFNLKQDGKALPDGPVIMSPDGLFPSLYREVIRRAPHEFKISCLETIKALFPPDCNPFYAGFGNRDTDEVSYIKVGIPRGKIFIINPRGEVAVNRRVDTKSYSSLHALVNGMFPTMSYREQEDFNSWNYWKLPPPDITI